MPERAAFLLRGLVQDHPFVDENKRTGFEAASVFISRNGLRLDAPDDAIVQYALDLASGRLDLDGALEWIRTHTEN